MHVSAAEQKGNRAGGLADTPDPSYHHVHVVVGADASDRRMSELREENKEEAALLLLNRLLLQLKIEEEEEEVAKEDLEAQRESESKSLRLGGDFKSLVSLFVSCIVVLALIYNQILESSFLEHLRKSMCKEEKKET